MQYVCADRDLNQSIKTCDAEASLGYPDRCYSYNDRCRCRRARIELVKGMSLGF